MNDRDYRAAYIRAKLDVLIPAQIKALRGEMTQAELGREANMKQSRISAMEMPGATNFNLETLVRLAAVCNVGLAVKFVPFSEMLHWENSFSLETFGVVPLQQDDAFLRPVRTDEPTTRAAAAENATNELAAASKKPPISDRTSGVVQMATLAAGAGGGYD